MVSIFHGLHRYKYLLINYLTCIFEKKHGLHFLYKYYWLNVNL